MRLKENGFTNVYFLQIKFLAGKKKQLTSAPSKLFVQSGSLKDILP